MKKIITLALALAMALSLCACSGAGTAGEAATGEATESSVIADSNNDGQIEVGTVENVEVNVAETHLDAAEASASGNWEALFVPIDIEGRAIDMANVDLTPTAEELEAMKKEPAYGRPIHYFMSDGCTSGPTMADHLGYYAEAGLTAEGVKGGSDVEALGTDQVDVATGMMAKMLVPITNGVDITFVGGAHIGCKSLYVLADSSYNTTADLKGQKVSAPNGIGKSDYNIVALLLDADGINYATDVAQRYLCLFHGQGGQAQVHPLPAGQRLCGSHLLRYGNERHLCQGESHDCQEGGSGRAEGTQLDA